MGEYGFWKIAQAQPERTAVVADDGERLSYAALAARANRLSHALRDAGLRRGDAITAVLGNGPEVFQLFLGAVQSGIYYVPVNYHGTADDIAYIVQNSESALVFFDGEYADKVQRALDAIDFPRERRIAIGAGGDAPALQDWIAPHSAQRPAQTPAGMLMQYTSGTTGRPKGVRRPLSSADADTAMAASALQLQWYGMQAWQGCHLVTSPLYHNAVFSHAMSALNLGHGVAIMRRWDEREFLRRAQETRTASTHVVATHFHRLLTLAAAEREAFDLASLQFVIHGAVPTPVPIKQAMMEWLGPVIYEYYGSSEVGATLAGPHDWLRKPGTVGRPLAITRLRILDDDGRELAQGERGWIYMRQGEQDFHYYKDEGKTRKANRDGFTCVGDIGYLDEEGFLFLCGRDAEIIISGGVNIYPAATEARLLCHPAVLDAGVIGVPDAEFGEQVKAVVALKPGHAATPELERELIAFCREHLAAINCPRSVDFAAELPRDPSGKLLKRRLRDPYWAGLERQI